MARKKRHEEHENLERWLVSYADFITLLFAFFVVMYSISSVNEGKYRVLSDTLVSAFNKEPKTILPVDIGSEGVSGPPVAVESKRVASEPSIIELLAATASTGTLDAMASDFEQALLPEIYDDLITVTRTDLWVEIEINTSLLFTSGSADLQDEALPVLRRLAEILRRYPNAIQVEGFTDNLPISTYLFPSNWELSAARAASVVHLFMREQVQPDRMAAVGYGEYRPVADNATPEGRRRNRRVVLVVLADANARRALEIQRSREAGGGVGG